MADRRTAVERAECDFRLHRHVLPGTAAFAKPAGAGKPGDVNAIALNNVPISPGSIKRRPPLSREARCYALARTESVRRSAWGPSAGRDRAWGPGPQNPRR